MQVSPVTMCARPENLCSTSCLPLDIKDSLTEDSRLLDGEIFDGELFDGAFLAEGKRIAEGELLKWNC
jgi:hypothetical protein